MPSPPTSPGARPPTPRASDTHVDPPRPAHQRLPQPLFPGPAETVRRTKDALADVLLLDAGDAVSAGNVGVRPGGEPILTRMSAAGYDAMTLGNREFHVADALLRCKLGKARFPVLCAT